MNIEQTAKGENLISIKISVTKEDYAPKTDEILKGLRRKANIPGFRPGMVPMGMVKKMYGVQAKMEALNDIVSENLNKHITDNNLNLLGFRPGMVPTSRLWITRPARSRRTMSPCTTSTRKGRGLISLPKMSSEGIRERHLPKGL